MANEIKALKAENEALKAENEALKENNAILLWSLNNATESAIAYKKNITELKKQLNNCVESSANGWEKCDGCHEHIDYNDSESIKGGICLNCMKCGQCGCSCLEEGSEPE